MHLHETYPWFWFLTTHKKINFKIHSLTKSLLRLNTFEIYLPPNSSHIFSIRTFSLYQTKVIFAFMKRIDVDHFYHKGAIEYLLIFITNWLVFENINFWLVCLNLIENPLKQLAIKTLFNSLLLITVSH